MGQPPALTPNAKSSVRRRKPLNLTRIKSVIVLIVGTATGIGSAITGLGANAAFAPMLTWMFGFSAEKAQVVALRYALYVSLAAVAFAFYAHLITTTWLLNGLLLMIGATIGAVLTASFSKTPAAAAKKPLFLTLGVGLAIFVAGHTAANSAWQVDYFAQWNASWMLFLIGIGVGALTQVLGLASGVLLVPALHYLAASPPKLAVVVSLWVIALASMLPVWAYSRRGDVEQTYSPWAAVGGILGGLAGAALLTRLPDKATLLLFALFAMFLCGRELPFLSTSSRPKTSE